MQNPESSHARLSTPATHTHTRAATGFLLHGQSEFVSAWRKAFSPQTQSSAGATYQHVASRFSAARRPDSNLPTCAEQVLKIYRWEYERPFKDVFN